MLACIFQFASAFISISCIQTPRTIQISMSINLHKQTERFVSVSHFMKNFNKLPVD